MPRFSQLALAEAVCRLRDALADTASGAVDTELLALADDIVEDLKRPGLTSEEAREVVRYAERIITQSN